MLIFIVACCTLTALQVIPVQDVAAISDAAILKPPENQYILEDQEAILTCNIRGKWAYWFINGNETNHLHNTLYYEGLGVTFNESTAPNHINLTMTIPAYVTSKVNNIECVAKDRNFNIEFSDPVWITVFKSFRPYPPQITIDAVYDTMALTELYVLVKGESLWPDYEISEFRVNITDTSSGSLLDQIIANNTFANNSVRVQILNQPSIDQWNLLTISVSAVNPLYNEGKPNQTTISIFSKCKQLPSSDSPLQDGDASLYKVVMGISLGIALVLLLASSVLLACFCIYYRRTRQQGIPSPSGDSNINRSMVPNPMYDCGQQLYDTIDHHLESRNDASRTKATPRYSNSPNHNTSSLDRAPRTQETIQMTYPATCVDTSCSGLKKCEKDRNKLHLTLPGVPSPLGYGRGQDDIRQEGCEKSEESQYVHMRQTGMLSQQAIQPVHMI